MFCPSCGHKNNDMAVRCENCGVPLVDAQKQTYGSGGGPSGIPGANPHVNTADLGTCPPGYGAHVDGPAGQQGYPGGGRTPAAGSANGASPYGYNSPARAPVPAGNQQGVRQNGGVQNESWPGGPQSGGVQNGWPGGQQNGTAQGGWPGGQQNVPVQYGVRPAGPVQRTAPAAKKSSFITSAGGKALIASLSGLVLLVLVFVITGLAISNPKSMVKKYFLAVQNKDWSTAYGYLNIKEDSFINLTNYKKAMGAGSSGGQADDISISKSGDNGTTFVISYTDSGTSSARTVNVGVVKSGKKMLFFNNYKIDGSSLVMDNYSLSCPPQTTVSLDGVQLTDSYLSGSAPSEEVTYVIPRLFIGTHEVQVSHPLCDDNTTQIAVDSSSSGSSIDLINLLKLKSSIRTELYKTTLDNITTVISGAMNKKRFDELGLAYDTNKKADLVDAYAEFQRDMADASVFKATSSKDQSEDSGLSLDNTYSCTAVLTYSYTYHKGTETATENDTNDFNFVYVYRDGKWLLTEFDY